MRIVGIGESGVVGADAVVTKSHTISVVTVSGPTMIV
jgi:hypothetical protein